ncbi:hypothetical protein PN462_14080 [Spirulina sp. CS-785/01]|uniref:hypothetical protein n=1 Tax=Spirulina sp. CS-785/01 TaxID=3021716 RepID=UPI00232AA107|nr:hypothetical protein [Spirulina sp. CS-785/01]MDB9314237.1 hypothetical protein [Spirulina sp. CS-785/01]
MLDINDYLFPNSEVVEGHPKHNDYIDCPANAFLDFCVTAKNSIEHCKEKFDNYGSPSKLTTTSHVRIQSLINSTLALIMGHFETYQKYLFAGIFGR